MKTYREADFFEEFAADWGGCRCGKCGVADYMRYVYTIADELITINRDANLYADTWSISYWGDDPLVSGWNALYEKEISASREVIDLLEAMPQNTHIALPCHHLYRALTYSSYGSKAKTPEFPAASDVAQVHAMGRTVLAWPHFVMDDDVYRPASWGIIHSEIRYIKHLLQSLRVRGIDGVMGNLYLPYLQISNTYAFGRLAANPDEDIVDIIEGFAALIAYKEDAHALAEVMMWVENNSYWEKQLPEDAKLTHLPAQLTGEKALDLLRSISANPSPEYPLPLPADSWLEDLRRSIAKMI